jgi:hypothetical protein
MTAPSEHLAQRAYDAFVASSTAPQNGEQNRKRRRAIVRLVLKLEAAALGRCARNHGQAT